MNKTLHVIGATILLVAIAAGCTAEEAVVKLDQPKQRISYTIGLNIGRDFVSQDVDIDTAALLAGVRDGLGGQKPPDRRRGEQGPADRCRELTRDVRRAGTPSAAIDEREAGGRPCKKV